MAPAAAAPRRGSRAQHGLGVAQPLEVGVHPDQPAAHRVDRRVRRAEAPPLVELALPLLGRALAGVDARLDPEPLPALPGRLAPAAHPLERLRPAALERALREEAVGELGGALERRLGRAADPERDRLLD